MQLKNKHYYVVKSYYHYSLLYGVRDPGRLVNPVRFPNQASVCVFRRCTTTRTCRPPQWSSYSLMRRGPPSSAPSTAYSIDPRLRQPSYIITQFNSCCKKHFRKMYFIHVISCGTRQRCPWIRNGVLYLRELYPVLWIRIRGPVIF